MGQKDGPAREVTHGICPDCYERLFGPATGVSLPRLLERVDVPLFVMDGDARVVAGNAMAAGVLGEAVPVLEGSFVGDVLECARARQPGGCGKAEGCSACTLRRTVTDTYATGQSHGGVCTVLRATDDGRQFIDVQVSTERVDRGVLLRIDQLARRRRP
jgi:hypothetical protein